MAYNRTKFPCISNKKSNRSECGRGVSGYFFPTLQNIWESLIREKRIYNPGQNTWNKIEKSSKTGKERKILISAFACFLTAIAKV